MTNDSTKARELLNAGNYTCVVCKDGTFLTATHRGVRPLLDWLDAGQDLRGFSAADRVVGRATAFLYVLLGVKDVYARVMSRPAAQVLAQHGVAVHYDTLTEGIVNRAGTGPCPFEDAVMQITHPQDALSAIRSKMAQMQKGT